MPGHCGADDFCPADKRVCCGGQHGGYRRGGIGNAAVGIHLDLQFDEWVFHDEFAFGAAECAVDRCGDVLRCGDERLWVGDEFECCVGGWQWAGYFSATAEPDGTAVYAGDI